MTGINYFDGLDFRKDKDKEAKEAVRKRATALSKAITKRSGNPVLDNINLANSLLSRLPSEIRDNLELVTTVERFKECVDIIIKDGITSCDTETTSLDPITCTFAGISFHMVSEGKSFYLPVNHINYLTFMPFVNQVPIDILRAELQRMKDANVEFIMHNAKFDIRVIRHQLDIDLAPLLHWDTMVASFLLNENVPHGLKALWNMYVAETPDDAKIEYETLFGKTPFIQIPLKTAYIYAARDALITYELYKYQKPYLDINDDKCKEKKLEKLTNLYKTIELPLVHVLCDIEDRGVYLDSEFAPTLKQEYHTEREKRLEAFYKLIEPYQSYILAYDTDKTKPIFTNPVNIGSNNQIAALVYDILGCPKVNKKKPDSVDADTLKLIDHPICKAIIKYREIEKLINTYIDKLPTVLNPKTGKIHTSFNQIGAVTGRISSSDVNLQNIPRKHGRIRNLFVASPGYLLISSDYSKQEPGVLCFMSGDKGLMDAWNSGLDIYAFIGSGAYGVSYEECLEFNPDGTENPAGKKRREGAKTIVLGIMYGRGAKSIAEQLGVDTKKAQQIINNFYDSFPGVRDFHSNLIAKASQTGYVETVWGRKRRLPELRLPEFEFSLIDGVTSNAVDIMSFEVVEESYIDPQLIAEYENALRNTWGWQQRQVIKEDARANGVEIKENGMKIADATRQAYNSPIQGSSSDMMKNAMVKLTSYQRGERWVDVENPNMFDHDLYQLSKQFHRLGGHILLQVHDELIVEAPEPVIFEVADIVKEVMIQSPLEFIPTVKMKVDLKITKCWNGDSIKRGK